MLHCVSVLVTGQNTEEQFKSSFSLRSVNHFISLNIMSPGAAHSMFLNCHVFYVKLYKIKFYYISWNSSLCLLCENSDSGPPPLKSKTKHLTAATSTLTVPDVSTCMPTPSTQTSLTPSTPAPTTPTAAPPEPSQVETASTDVGAPQPEDSKGQEVKKDTAESEVRIRRLYLCHHFVLLCLIH